MFFNMVAGGCLAIVGLIFGLMASVLTFFLYVRLKEAKLDYKLLERQKRRLFIVSKNLQFKLNSYNAIIAEEDTDQLTMLHNIGGFQKVTKQLLQYSEKPFSYYVICLDVLDADFWDHEIRTEEQVIASFAHKLRNALPPTSALARHDYCKFYIGIEGDKTVVNQVLVRLAKILELPPKLANSYFGVSHYPTDSISHINLIKLAEKRLYLNHVDSESVCKNEYDPASVELAAGLAHEIRNPLMSIRGCVQMLSQESEQFQKWEHVIVPEIDRINELLKQFLKLGEDKDRHSQFTKFSLNELIEHTIILLKSEAQIGGNEIIAHPPGYTVTLEADAEQIKQVLINLIKNALESLRENGRVNILWKENNRRVLIRIQDNGVGIPENYVEEVFEPFFTTKEEGTGMGLAICHKIIEEHKGSIHFSSKENLGSVFNIELPARQGIVKAKETKKFGIQNTAIQYS